MDADKGAPSAEFKRRDCDIPMNCEGCDILGSEALSVSADSERSKSSTDVCTNIMEGDSSNRCATSLGGPEPPTAMNDTSLVVEELTIRNYKSPGADLVGSSNTKGVHYGQGQWRHLYQLGRGSRRYGDFTSSDKDAELLGSRENLQRTPFGLSNRQDNLDPDEIPAHLTDNYNKVLSINKLPLGNKQSKALSSSSFSQFLSKQSLKGKEVLSKNPETGFEVSFTTMAQSKDKQGFENRIASDALLNSSVKIDQPSKSSIDKGSIEAFSNEISLRKWLNTGCSEMNTIKKLHIFRQVVQLVDFAHSQGVTLQDLRPSCLVLLSTNRVKYTGSSTQIEFLNVINQDINRKRTLEQKMNVNSELGGKQQKLGVGIKSIRHQPHFKLACGVNSEAMNEIDTKISCLQDFDSTGHKARGCSTYQSTFVQTCQRPESVFDQLEKKWYASPEELNERGLLSSNIYSLGVLLFELLSCFESLEKHSAAMSDLRCRILPPYFLSENPKEAGFCLWLLHPEPSSRPSTREILQSELFCDSEEFCPGEDLSLCIDKEDDADSELLLHFLIPMKDEKQNHAAKLLENIGFLEADIMEVERRHMLRASSDRMDHDLTDAKRQASHHEDDLNTCFLSRSCSDTPKPRLIRNISQLESTYFSTRSQIQLPETVAIKRSDKDLLTSHDRWSEVQIENKKLSMEGKHVDCLGAFSEGICKFARYSKFDVCGTLRNGDLLNSANVICSLSFDREDDYIAAAGVSKKIKVFEFSSLLDDSVDIHYPVVELPNKSKVTCVCWNNYIKTYLASTDYDGVVQMWDTSTGQGFSQYKEHQKRAWSVDFSQVDPTKFASGSDDCAVKLWSINEKGSIGTMWNPANVCCVQFSVYSSHLLAFGSADYKIYCYDLRHTRIPWCTLAGHRKAVSYVKFLDSETIVSASTDNTLKLWDLNKTSLEGLSSNACSLTLQGHTNEKNFVGLSVLDGYIACGSESNEVYAYYRSLPMPMASHKFGPVDPISGHEDGDNSGQFVSSVCWRKKSNMVAAANSSGSIKVLQMV